MSMLVAQTVKCAVMVAGSFSHLGEEMLKIFGSGWEI